jgi:DNA-binding NtrC family response regulator
MMIKILIADDLEGNRELIREVLASPKYAFSEAESACQVLQIMRNQPADLVISDVKMPGSSGVDLLRELHSKYRETAVILVTAFGTVEGAVEAMKAGARHYFTRPVDIRELRLVVEHALEHIDVQTEVRLRAAHWTRSANSKRCSATLMRCSKSWSRQRESPPPVPAS